MRIFNVKPYFEVETHSFKVETYSFKFTKHHVSRSRTYLVPKMPFLNYHGPVPGGGGALLIMAYTGRLRPKGVPFFNKGI